MAKNKFIPEIPSDFLKESPDPTPVAVPLDFQKPKTLEQLVAEICYNQMALNPVNKNDHVETIDEFDDFEIDDEDPDFISAYEDEHFDGYDNKGNPIYSTPSEAVKPDPDGAPVDTGLKSEDNLDDEKNKTDDNPS